MLPLAVTHSALWRAQIRMKSIGDAFSLYGAPRVRWEAGDHFLSEHASVRPCSFQKRFCTVDVSHLSSHLHLITEQRLKFVLGMDLKLQ